MTEPTGPDAGQPGDGATPGDTSEAVQPPAGSAGESVPAAGYPAAPPPPPTGGEPVAPPLGGEPALPPLAAQGYGQPAAPGMYFDQESGLTLPEGVRLASHGRRIGAYFLAFPLSIVTLGIGYIVWGLIVWGSGQTPALQVLGMRCWRPDEGRVAHWGWMALREIIGGLAEGILSVVSELISFIMFLSRGDRRCLHDLIAGTVVVHDPGKVLASKGA
jgi:uncharacterized RDD family membrane protein YckC